MSYEAHFLMTSQDSGGSLLVVETRHGPGVIGALPGKSWSPPKHIHRLQRECFSVLSGTMGYEYDGTEGIATPDSTSRQPLCFDVGLPMSGGMQKIPQRWSCGCILRLHWHWRICNAPSLAFGSISTPISVCCRDWSHLFTRILSLQMSQSRFGLSYDMWSSRSRYTFSDTALSTPSIWDCSTEEDMCNDFAL
eukprot:jgi/Botrbrau1/13412/Bobra.0082s0018.2